MSLELDGGTEMQLRCCQVLGLLVLRGRPSLPFLCPLCWRWASYPRLCASWLPAGRYHRETGEQAKGRKGTSPKLTSPWVAHIPIGGFQGQHWMVPASIRLPWPWAHYSITSSFIYSVQVWEHPLFNLLILKSPWLLNSSSCCLVNSWNVGDYFTNQQIKQRWSLKSWLLMWDPLLILKLLFVCYFFEHVFSFERLLLGWDWALSTDVES